MTSKYESKHGIVKRPPYELYMSFVDMRNFEQMIPEEKRGGVKADYDTITTSVQGFNIGVKVYERTPYSQLVFVDYDAPFAFQVVMRFDPTGVQGETDFSVEVSADLNLMMKMMLGSKIKEALDKLVDSMVDLSEGRMPAGMDASSFRGSPFGR